MSRLASLPLLALAWLTCSPQALAAREANPEAIAFWRAAGPTVILIMAIASILIVLVVALILARRAKRP
ncbi:hypothetical protein [Halotalea alkalilenta]|uniref:Uncharacterized protein n=1 Tax=Halotalea alkalilenta TaxID=376489 RepID=A0A172YBJ6_9GAMM|nr:hypothetical protein [Halotalea alkalilenta]ANF56621.1 hypothetical protein A5892_03355 [Halotalea alkalilenta]